MISPILKFKPEPIKKARGTALDSAFVLFKKEKNINNLNALENKKNKPILFSRGKITNCFFTEDSKLYITPKEQKLIDEGLILNRKTNAWDSLSSRILKNYRHYQPNSSDILYKALVKRYHKFQETLENGSKSIISQWSMVKLWNFSLIGAIILGMFSMTLIYRFLGPGALAGRVVDKDQSASVIQNPGSMPDNAKVLGASTAAKDDSPDDAGGYIEKTAAELKKEKQDEFEKTITDMVKGYPIEKMLPYILEKDQTVAAYLVAIARKESGWGEHVPVLKGQDCYNYWGYRGQRKLMGTGGHTCFNSRKDAIDTVAKRIKYLVENQNRQTPDKMVIWKCGSACKKDNPVAVRGWINDVSLYFNKLNK